MAFPLWSVSQRCSVVASRQLTYATETLVSNNRVLRVRSILVRTKCGERSGQMSRYQTLDELVGFCLDPSRVGWYSAIDAELLVPKNNSPKYRLLKVTNPSRRIWREPRPPSFWTTKRRRELLIASWNVLQSRKSNDLRAPRISKWKLFARVWPTYEEMSGKRQHSNPWKFVTSFGTKSGAHYANPIGGIQGPN